MNFQEWTDFLKPRKKTDEDWNRASIHAQKWYSCAVSTIVLPNFNVDPKHVNKECGKALNGIIATHLSPKAERLGSEFYEAIDNQQLGRARELFEQIRVLKPKKML